MSAEQETQKPLYEAIVEDEEWLNIGTENDRHSFFAAHLPTISKKLLNVGSMMRQGMKSDQGEDTADGEPSESYLYVLQHDIFGINQCLHLANVVLLLGTTSEHLGATMAKIVRLAPFTDQDPTTVIASAVLVYLLEAVAALPGSDEKQANLQHIRRRFAQSNWMLNAACVTALGLPAADASETAGADSGRKGAPPER